MPTQPTHATTVIAILAILAVLFCIRTIADIVLIHTWYKMEFKRHQRNVHSHYNVFPIVPKCPYKLHWISRKVLSVLTFKYFD